MKTYPMLAQPARFLRLPFLRSLLRGIMAVAVVTALLRGTVFAQTISSNENQTGAAAAVRLLTIVGTQKPSPPAAGMALHEFGHVSALEPTTVTHAFLVRNDNPTAITIERLQPSCGCTSALLEKADDLPFIMNPGQQTQVRVSVDLSHLAPGAVRKDVWLFVHGQSAPAATLEVVGTLQPAAIFSPAVLDFGHVPAGKEHPILLTVALDPRLVAAKTPLRLACSTGDIQIAPIPQAASSVLSNSSSKLETPPGFIKQTYRVSLSPRARLGVLSETLSLLTANVDAQGQQRALASPVPIIGEVEGSISASPGAVVFGTVSAGRAASAQVTLSGITPDALANLKMVAASPYVSVTLAPVNATQTGVGGMPARKARLLSIAVSSKIPVGTLQTQVIVTTTKGEQLVLPVFISVVR